MFKPCAIIPIYNHCLKIEEIVDYFCAQALPCFLLDDGSNKECAEVLKKLGHLNGVELIRWDENRGKGAVVCDGLKRVYESGFTHALQIDADGQHDLNDIEAMLALAQAFPEDVVSAARPYSEMPKSRRQGRKITDFWVWVNTLSGSIKDSMCGFRVYPLPNTYKLLSASNIGRRMDFDTDILVRLYWQGVNVQHVPTSIRYDENNTSHFKMLADNVRISKMHTRLFFGMLIRAPQLIARNFS
ncbi:MAG: glycosyltransferase family 2 protein [Agarilytica sp.]